MVPLIIAIAYTSYDTITSAFEFAEHELSEQNNGLGYRRD